MVKPKAMKQICIFILLIQISFTTRSQHDQRWLLREASKSVKKFTPLRDSAIVEEPPVNSSEMKSGFIPLTKKVQGFHAPNFNKSRKSRDTLFVFDTMTVTGTWSYNGPVYVVNTGHLKFIHANATILGDIVVWGPGAILEADSSILHIPQQYFYERTMLISAGGAVKFRNTTLDHSNLSHSVALTDSSHAYYENVTNLGFTTCGLYGDAGITINGTNQAGEFIITDYSTLRFTDANTVLLWHQIPPGAVFNRSFPDGLSGVNYNINPSSSGVSGINFNVTLNNCSDVMWGIMPVNNSDITITDSHIRSIGMWFIGNDTININGLVNNTAYSDFTPTLPDRHLRLINSSVMTWSIYPMEFTTLNITGCIVGEIGAMGRSVVNTQNIIVDGSGGYFWAGDESFIIAWGNSATTSVRSEKNGIFIYAYSSVTNGLPAAIGNSILICIQSSLPDDPIPYQGGVVMMDYIGRVSPAFVDSSVAVKGSAWIDRGPGSFLMDFNWYSLFYQKPNDTTWYLLKDKTRHEVRDDILALWNTHGLLPGVYNLKLIICDNSSDINRFEAQKAVTLARDITAGLGNNSCSLHQLVIYPNPAKEEICLIIPAGCENAFLTISDIYGRKWKYFQLPQKSLSEHEITCAIGDLPQGMYFCSLNNCSYAGSGIFIKY